MYYFVGINTIILLLVSQLGTLFASGASFWCYININELYIKKRLCLEFLQIWNWIENNTVS